MDWSGLIDALQRERAVLESAPYLSLLLVVLGGATGCFLAKSAYESRLATKDATIELLRASLDHQREPEHQKLGHLEPHPTVEMLEASRKEMDTHRKELIRSWRAMVGEAHAQLQYMKLTGVAATPTEIMETLPEFLTYRQHMSEDAKDAVYRDVEVTPPPGSTMHGTLHRILKDTERLEREWRLT